MSPDGAVRPRLEAPIEALILDLDGTLLDHVGSVRAGLTDWLPTLGAASSEELITAWFTAEEEHFSRWQTGAISFAEQRRRRLRDFLPLIGQPVGDDASLDRHFDGYRSAYQRGWQAFGDVLPALRRLDETRPDLPRAVLTNGSDVQQRAKLSVLGLAELLPRVFSAEALGVAKPAAAAYLGVCAELGTEPGRTLHVGDRYDLDVVAARAAGLQAVHLDRDDTGPQDEPLRIRDLTGLLPLISDQP